MSLGEFVKKCRSVLDISQEELGARIGATQKTISRLENRRDGIPSPEVMDQLAAALSLSVVDLLRGAGYRVVA